MVQVEQAGGCTPGRSSRSIGSVGLLCCASSCEGSEPDLPLERIEALARSCRSLVLDLGESGQLDPDGARALGHLAGQLRATRRALVVVAWPGTQARRTLTALNGQLNIRVCANLVEAYRCCRPGQQAEPCREDG